MSESDWSVVCHVCSIVLGSGLTKAEARTIGDAHDQAIHPGFFLGIPKDDA